MVEQMPRLRGAQRERYIDYASSIGVKATDRLELAEKVQKGFPYESFIKLSELIELNSRFLADLVQISQRTLTRRRKEGKLQPDESERLLRYSKLLRMTIDLFEGNEVAAHRWLLTSNRSLGGRTPLEASKTEVGAREVENLVTRLEYGVFS